MKTHEKITDPHHDPYSKTVFGFWLYLLTDFVLFATILASYFVLRNSTFGGPKASDLLPLSFTFAQSLLLLSASFTAALGGAFAFRKNKRFTSLFFAITFVLGLSFLWMEFSGFSLLIQQGQNWTKSAFLSAYFTLLGTHAIHVIFALLWILVLAPLLWYHGFTHMTLQRISCLKLFWQFLNLIWVGIFTMVYLMGVS